MKELNGFLGAALQFAALDIALHESMKNGLEEAARRIAETAKDEVGHYQPAVGPFNKWDDLAESTEANKAQRGFPANAPLERTGGFRDSGQFEVKGFDAVVGSKDEKAPWFEFDTSRMPPRPVIGPVVIHNSRFIKSIIGRAVVEGISSVRTVHPSLGYNDLI